MNQRLLSCVITGMFSVSVSSAVFAQIRNEPYPSKPVTIVVPYASGSTADIDARGWAQPLGESLGRPFVLDFKVGAASTIGTTFVARAAPDGYTLLYGTGPFLANAVMYPKLTYDPIKDFSPVSLVSKRSLVLVITPSFPARNLKEYIAFARSRPGEINYGTNGAGGSYHISGAWLGSVTNTVATFVHYKGSAQLYVDLVAGRVHVSPMTLYSALPFIKSGKVRAIAQLGLERSAFAPDDLQTAAEQGAPGFDWISWQGLLAPAGTPADVVRRLNAVLASFARSPAAIANAAKEGAEMVGSTPEFFGKLLIDELVRWRKVVQENNIKLEE